MVLRLVLGILAAVFLPLGLVFTVVGLTANEVDSGEPRDFLRLGIALAAVGAGFALAFLVASRREAERRRRRREGLRATAEVVRARVNPNVRVGSSVTVDLTVRFATAGTPDGTVTRTLLVAPFSRLEEGATIEILYDPADPSNFEPAATGVPTG